MNKTNWAAVGALGVNAFVWGLSWWPMRQLDALGLHPLWTTACVFTLAFLGLSLQRPRAWRAFAHHRTLWWLALASGLTNVCFNWAVTTGDVLRVVLLFYMMPTWAIGLAWWLLGERPTPSALWRLLLTLVGVVLVLQTPSTPWPVPQDPADLLGLLGGMCFAWTNILLLKLNRTPSASRMVAMFGGGALTGVLCAVLAVSLGLATPLPTDMSGAWPWLLGLTLAFLVSNLALQYGAARLSAHTTAMVMMSEVVFASVSSVSLGSAILTWRVGLGGCLIVLAAVLAARTIKDAAAPTQD